MNKPPYPSVYELTAENLRGYQTVSLVTTFKDMFSTSYKHNTRPKSLYRNGVHGV